MVTKTDTEIINFSLFSVELKWRLFYEVELNCKWNYYVRTDIKMKLKH